MDNNEDRRKVLSTKPIGKLLWQFAAPSIIAMSATSIYNFCDSIFIGQGAGPLAISGLAITFPLMNISAAFGSLAGTGGAAQTSVYMGMNQRKIAQFIFGNVLLLNLCIGITLSVVGLYFLDPILQLFGASEATLPYARDYMQIYLCGICIHHMFLGMSGQLRAIGYPRLAMTSQVSSVIINIFLDALFIFGFGWGIRGAALATVLAQTCGFLATSWFLRSSKNRYVHLSWNILHFNARIIGKIISIGLSPFSVNICGCFIVVVLNHALLEQGGVDGDLCVGANGITNRITQLIILMVAGFSQGMQPIVGFNLGANLYHRVRETLILAVTIAIIILTTGYIFVAAFPASLASLFTSDQVLIDYCVPALRISLCTFPFVGSQLIATAFFQSIRKPGLSMLISLSRQLLFLLPLLLILPPIMGVNGVWWSMPIADVFSITLSIILLRREYSKLKNQYITKK